MKQKEADFAGIEAASARQHGNLGRIPGVQCKLIHEPFFSNLPLYVIHQTSI